MPSEFRVRWRREGRGVSTQIYQAWDDAYKKAQRVKAIEAIKPETKYESMPPIIEGPTIEVREVGQWAANEHQPGEPSEYVIEDVRRWACPDPDPEPAGSGPFGF